MRKRQRAFFTTTLTLLGIFMQAHTAFAQAYVPVIDINMQTLFPQYTTDLFRRWDQTFGPAAPNGNTDSLRDLISGANPQGLAVAPCQNGDNQTQGLLNEPDRNDPDRLVPAFAYTNPNQSWAIAHATSVAANVGNPYR